MDKRQADVRGLAAPALSYAHPLSQARRITSVPPAMAGRFLLLVVGVVATWVMHAPAELAAIVVAGVVLAFAVELAGDQTWRRITARGPGFEVGAERQLAQEIERAAGELVDIGSTPVRMTEAAGSGDAEEHFGGGGNPATPSC